MQFFDITVPISNSVPIYEGDPRALVESTSRIIDGAPANVSKLCFGAHTGTHIDAPNHFIEGTRRIDDLDLEKLIGPCRVHQLDENVTVIRPEHLSGLEGIKRILLKTRNSAFWNESEKGFRTDFTYITPEAAKFLVEIGCQLIGIDYLSVERFGSEDFETHRILLEREIVVLEGVDLRDVSAGEYELICLPLKYIGGNGDGAPARTILRQTIK